MTGARVIPAAPAHLAAWVRMRQALWPDDGAAVHETELRTRLDARDPAAADFVALDPADAVAGFAEASVRRDFVNGCGPGPVAFLEGLYVDPAHRGRGVARALCEAVSRWGAAAGCRELASDSELANADAHAMHAALGFEETERVVFFRKAL